MAMRILVIGAGAVGGYFGGWLCEAGRDVTFLVHAKRAEEIRNHGLRIVSPHGDATLSPRTLLAEQLEEPYDLILLSVKAYALESAMKDFAPAVGPETMILPVLNGIRHIELLTARFGETPVIGGVCLVATDLDKDDRIVQLAEVQTLTYGERGGGSSERLARLDETMQGAAFDAHLSENIVQEMWKKWFSFRAWEAATCLFRGNVGEIEAIHGGAALALQILDECCAIATAWGYSPREAFLARVRSAMSAPGSTLASSMYRDLHQGRPVEVDQILGDLLARGRTLEIRTPLVEAAFVNLSVYQARQATR